MVTTFFRIFADIHANDIDDGCTEVENTDGSICFNTCIYVAEVTGMHDFHVDSFLLKNYMITDS